MALNALPYYKIMNLQFWWYNHIKLFKRRAYTSLFLSKNSKENIDILICCLNQTLLIFFTNHYLRNRAGKIYTLQCKYLKSEQDFWRPPHEFYTTLYETGFSLANKFNQGVVSNHY